MDSVAAPITSPLKVRQRKDRMWAEDAAGRAVVDGTTRQHWPDRYVCSTPSGAWRINATVEAGALVYLPVLDPSGQEVARIDLAGRHWSLVLPGGEVAAVTSGGGMLTGIHCEIGRLSRAVAPRLAPQRYITLIFSPEALAHPSASAIAVAAVWISEMKIASLISDAGGGAD